VPDVQIPPLGLTDDDTVFLDRDWQFLNRCVHGNRSFRLAIGCRLSAIGFGVRAGDSFSGAYSAPYA
jgi:hypothetical protein